MLHIPHPISTPLYTVHHNHATPFKYSTISSPPNLLSPYTRSTNVIGHSSTSSPIAFARTIISIWKVYPFDSVVSITD